jgi:DNA-binding MarR family transcriptional regulator
MAMENTRTKRINQLDHGGNTMPRYTCPVKIRGVLYNSQKEAAEAIGVTQSAIYRALQNGTLEKCGVHNRNRKPVTIRGVYYESQTAAAKALGLRQTNIAKAVRNGNLKGIGLGHNATTKRKVWIDGVEYDSQAAAARALGVTADNMQWILTKHRSKGIYEFEHMGHTVKSEPRND